MAGFSGATGVPLKQMQDAIAQSTAVVALSTSILINVSGSGNRVYANRSGNVVCVDIVLYPSANLSANTTIAKVTMPSILVQETHTACITSSSALARLYMDQDGNIKIENAISANQWIACTLTNILAV